MNNELPKTSSPNTLPAEAIGSYSTWKKRDGSGEDSNRHTYLVGEDGKRRVTSRKKFNEMFAEADAVESASESDVVANHAEPWPTQGRPLEWWESTWPGQTAQPTPKTDWKRIPRDRGFEGAYRDHNAASEVSEPEATWERIPRDRGFEGAYTTNPVVVEESAVSDGETQTSTVEYWSAGTISSTDPNRTPYSSTESPVDETEQVRRFTGLRRNLSKLALGAVLGFGLFAAGGDTDRNVEHTQTETPTEITIEATPVPTPEHTDYKIVDVTPEMSTDRAEVTLGTEADEVPVEMIEPQSPIPLATPESTDQPPIQPTEKTDAPTSTGEQAAPIIESIEEQSTAEKMSTGTPEILMANVEVAPGDGITHVLDKIFTEAGYQSLTSEQLYGLYEELVTNPEVGPDGIFVGITVEYNEAIGEYWIQCDAGATTHLTGTAAQVISNVLLGE